MSRRNPYESFDEMRDREIDEQLGSLSGAVKRAVNEWFGDRLSRLEKRVAELENQREPAGRMQPGETDDAYIARIRKKAAEIAAGVPQDDAPRPTYRTRGLDEDLL